MTRYKAALRQHQRGKLTESPLCDPHAQKSTGLGLAIVHQLAKLHAATVDVETEEGKGSLFRVTFQATR